MEKILKVDHLSITYDTKLVVDDVVFSLERGKIAAIVGESGSGKTTLLRSIVGLLPSNARVDSGNIYFEERNLLGLSNTQWQQYHGNKIGTIFQNPEQSLSPLVKIEKQFYECVQAHQNKTKKEIYQETINVLKNLRFEDPDRILKSYPFELSGGMCQRVAIALAIMNHPSLLCADEPTSALDVASENMTIETMMDLNKQTNMSILIVTHNIGVAYKMADYIGVMYQGKMIEWGKTQDIIRNPQNEYTKKLINAVPKIG